MTGAPLSSKLGTPSCDCWSIYFLSFVYFSWLTSEFTWVVRLVEVPWNWVPSSERRSFFFCVSLSHPLTKTNWIGLNITPDMKLLEVGLRWFAVTSLSPSFVSR